jgi:hydroxymethylbilane synthase
LQTVAIRIGTRGSPLALVQAEETRRLIMATDAVAEGAVEITPIQTLGDAIRDRPLSDFGGKGLFTKDIDEALLTGRVALAVHSAKDMPTRLPDGLVLAACLVREDVRDAILSPGPRNLAELKQGAVLGTSSLRRKALALRARPDLTVIDFRGNVGTRMRKLEEGAADATLLAVAGLKRLGLADRAAGILDTDEWLPAIGQGAIAIVAREDDADTRALLARLDHAETSVALAVERAFLTVLDGSCRTPIGGLARIEEDQVHFRGIIVKPDGSEAHTVERRGAISDAEVLGADAGAELAARGGRAFFDE